jgi:hypothetical protein
MTLADRHRAERPVGGDPHPGRLEGVPAVEGDRVEIREVGPLLLDAQRPDLSVVEEHEAPHRKWCDAVQVTREMRLALERPGATSSLVR